jgi:hypothetical protein
MKTLKFEENLIKLILTKEKTSTWRLFDNKNLSEGDILSLLNTKTKKEFAKAKINSIKETTFKELTEKDLEGHEKFSSKEEMYQTYSRYYSQKIHANTSLRIVRFKLLTQTET